MYILFYIIRTLQQSNTCGERTCSNFPSDIAYQNYPLQALLYIHISGMCVNVSSWLCYNITSSYINIAFLIVHQQQIVTQQKHLSSETVRLGSHTANNLPLLHLRLLSCNNRFLQSVLTKSFNFSENHMKYKMPESSFGFLDIISNSQYKLKIIIYKSKNELIELQITQMLRP